VIAAAARAGHVLWSFDSDFERIAGVLGDLQLHGCTAQGPSGRRSVRAGGPPAAGR
jgi:hypothetical protein